MSQFDLAEARRFFTDQTKSASLANFLDTCKKLKENEERMTEDEIGKGGGRIIIGKRPSSNKEGWCLTVERGRFLLKELVGNRPMYEYEYALKGGILTPSECEGYLGLILIPEGLGSYEGDHFKAEYKEEKYMWDMPPKRFVEYIRKNEVRDKNLDNFLEVVEGGAWEVSKFFGLWDECNSRGTLFWHKKELHLRKKYIGKTKWDCHDFLILDQFNYPHGSGGRHDIFWGC